MKSVASIQTQRHEVRVEGDAKGFDVVLTAESLETGVDVVKLRLKRSESAAPPQLTVVFDQPIIDTHARWHPGGRSNRAIYPEWDSKFTTQMTRYAPVACFYSYTGMNRLTTACSEVILPVEIRAGVFEEGASVKCNFALFLKPHPPIDQHETSILIDTREVPYHDALKHVGRWWEAQPDNAPLEVPNAARVPLYSTWYSFHQDVSIEGVVAQCRLARELGCEAVIVDDGWQTMDNHRGYPYTGDWEPVRIGDMTRFVREVHEAGLAFMLWYSLPFVGTCSKAIKRFEGKLFRQIEHAKAAVLDPRYEEVRVYLVDVLEKAMREWDLDGFKLDFVDWLDPSAETEPKSGMDIPRITDATHRLLSDIVERLGSVKPEPLIEFRQPYTGPRMRHYANMFRSVDCPNDAFSNRINTLDLRLLCGKTAIHSDMFMWHPDDPVQSAALQLLSVLFSVPQVSVLIDQVPASHWAMLRFWLRFWREHRDVLLDGDLAPQQPHALYPFVLASTPGKRVVAVYEDAVVTPGTDVPETLLLVNATRLDRVVVEMSEDVGERNVEVFDCTGQRVRQAKLALAPGLHRLDIPAAGLMIARSR